MRLRKSLKLFFFFFTQNMYANVLIAPVIAEKHIYDFSHVSYRELNFARTNYGKKILKIFLFLRLKKVTRSYHVTCVFRVNLHSVIDYISSNSLLETDATSEIQITATRLEPATS